MQEFTIPSRYICLGYIKCRRYEPFIFIIDDPTVNRKFFAKLVIEKITDPHYLASFESTLSHDSGIKFGFKENHQGCYMEEELKCPKQ